VRSFTSGGSARKRQTAEPIFTPSTKAQAGHDENISFAQTVAADRRGPRQTAARFDARNLFSRGPLMAESARASSSADTKFEFGFVDGTLVLRRRSGWTAGFPRVFWPADTYGPRRASSRSISNFVRDYLESIQLNKPPAPPLPQEVAAKTSEKYLQAYQALTGHQL